MENIINNNMEYYCMYLRKSRKDVEAEQHGQGETLAKHEKRLQELAESMNIKIIKTYKEIVSGDSIACRPVMQQLLSDIENNMWTGVLVVEVERLARGDTIDQGIVAQAFKNSFTKIITPTKIYDPNNEFDEEYFEFGLFMSRREYKTITRRLHNGIISAIKEGKHVSGVAPYGYDKIKLKGQKGFSLIPNEETSKNVQLIYNMYSNGIGAKTICKKLEELNIHPIKSKYWQSSCISNILTNPVYIGKIKYIDKRTIKKVVDGKVKRIKNDYAETIVVDGIHEPIIDIKLWNKVQDIRKNNLITSVKVDTTIKNPMAGLLKCSICGMSLERITDTRRNETRVCCRKCKENIGSRIELVEEKLLDSLKVLLTDYKIKLINNDNTDIELLLTINSNNINNSNIEIGKVQKQLNNTYDLLEQGIYDKNTFIERSNLLKLKISELNNQLEKLYKEKKEIEKNKDRKEILVPEIEKVIDSYYETQDIQKKNKLLKSVLKKVQYSKIAPKSPEDFNLILFPKL